jgi:hypothetical protein
MHLFQDIQDILKFADFPGKFWGFRILHPNADVDAARGRMEAIIPLLPGKFPSA